MNRNEPPQPKQISRRTILGAAAGAMLAMRPALAQTAPQAPRVKGPLVWLDMDQKELDDAYDQSVYASNQQQLLKRDATKSADVRRYLGEPRRYAYGPTPIEGLDVFMTSRPKAPINIFIHGGGWRSGRSSDSHWPAEMFVNAGAHFVVLDFCSVLDVGGNLMPMADQVRRAVAWVYRNAATFGGDHNRIFVSGRSSGAHLTAVVLTTDWVKDFNLPPDTVKGGLFSSGMYDLKPVRLSKRGAYVKFTDEMEHALSPQRHLHLLNAPVIVGHGTLETPEFQRQARDFAAAVKAAGKPVQLLVGQHYNHGELPETIASPYGLLGRAVLEQMNLRAGGFPLPTGA
jgi:arylformamidase